MTTKFESYTRQKVIDFFSTIEEGSTSFELKDKSIITIIKKKEDKKSSYSLKFNFSDKIEKQLKDSLKAKGQESNLETYNNLITKSFWNYTTYTDMIHEFLSKNNLLPVWFKDSLLIESSFSSTSDFDSNFEEKPKVEPKEEKAFSFEDVLTWIPALSQTIETTKKDLDDFLDRKVISLTIDNTNNMLVRLKTGDTVTKTYKKDIVISLLCKFIVELVNNKKNNGWVIDHLLTLHYEKSVQNLNIMEGDDGEDIILDDDWFTDSKLSNSIFVLCSLSDLTVNENKLKVWLNKIMLNTEWLKKVMFNI